MNLKNETLANKIWYIAYPILFYYAVMLITMSLAQWIIGNDYAHIVPCQLFATLITIPFMLPFYRQDQALAGIPGSKPKITKKTVLSAAGTVVIAACIGIGLNNVISMTPLVTMSAGYQEANMGFYGSTLVLEILSSALFTPILEELVFRGILYNRLKRILPMPAAIVGSALIFAMVHFNVVQFIYAFLFGFVLTLLMERGSHFGYAVLGHMTANLIAVVRTETGLLDSTVTGSAGSWAVSIVLLVAGIGALAFYFFKRE